MKKVAAKSQRASKEVSSIQPRARRLMREALTYWKRYERVEKEQRKKAEKEAMEQRRRDDEMREVGTPCVCVCVCVRAWVYVCMYVCVSVVVHEFEQS